MPDAGAVIDYNRFLYTRANPLKYADPSGHFTEDALKDYLRRMHGDLWEQYWNQWTQNSAWMDLLGTAQAGDRFAYVIHGQSGAVWHEFEGAGDTYLGAVNLLTAPFDGQKAGTSMMTGLMPSNSGTPASGLLRYNSDNGVISVVPTERFPAIFQGYRSIGESWAVTGSYYLEVEEPLSAVSASGFRIYRAVSIGYGMMFAGARMPLAASSSPVIEALISETLAPIQAGQQMLRVQETLCVTRCDTASSRDRAYLYPGRQPGW